jgi:hypothetical protein
MRMTYLIGRVAALAVLAASTAFAQVRVSGRVVDETGTAPVAGASVRVTGSDTTMTTGPSGTFAFGGLIPGKMVLTVSAVGRRFVSMPLELEADTVITVVMRPHVVALDPLVIRPGALNIKGTIVDSVTGDYLWFAQAGIYPGERWVNARNADFKFDKVAPGPVTIVVEAAEYLPAVISFDARRDTAFRVKLVIDTVARRMIARQINRLDERAEAQPYDIRAFTREDFDRERAESIGRFIGRQLFRPQFTQREQMAQSASDACVFYDDRRIPPQMLQGILPELVERVEFYRRGAMIRVYSKRYVRSLIVKEVLPKLTYIPTGFGPMCA